MSKLHGDRTIRVCIVCGAGTRHRYCAVQDPAREHRRRDNAARRAAYPAKLTQPRRDP
jgi:hypothetical protein